MSYQAQTDAFREQPCLGQHREDIAMTFANPEPQLDPIIIVERRS